MGNLENFTTDTKQEKKLFWISDLYTAAFLVLSGLKFTLEEKNNKIFFCFIPSQELYKQLTAFNENANVDVAGFSQEVRRLRAIMFEAKGRNNHGQ